MRSGTSYGAVFFKPRGSPPIKGVNGSPLLAWKIPPSSHPLAAHPAGPCSDFVVGTVQIRFCTKFLPILKSAGPRLDRSLKKNKPEMEFPNGSPARLAEPSSMALL